MLDDWLVLMELVGYVADAANDDIVVNDNDVASVPSNVNKKKKKRKNKNKKRAGEGESGLSNEGAKSAVHVNPIDLMDDQQPEGESLNGLTQPSYLSVLNEQ